MRWTEEQYSEFLGKQDTSKQDTPKTKYRNKKTEVDGIIFDSKKEANRYKELLTLKQIGEVIKIELQPQFILLPTFRKNGKTYRSIKYIADFKVTYKDGHIEIEDVKGYKTPVFKLKQKIFEYTYPEFTIKLI